MVVRFVLVVSHNQVVFRSLRCCFWNREIAVLQSGLEAFRVTALLHTILTPTLSPAASFLHYPEWLE